MTELHTTLDGSPRLLLEAELTPIQGDRFQPTGFADLGAAIYELPDGTRKLLVESAQSVANRLERTIVDADGVSLVPELEGLPFVKAKLEGAVELWTSSLVEAHRLNSPFIITDKGFQKRFLERSGYAKGKPIQWSKVAAAIFALDPNSLLHGVFMANLEDGRLRTPRMISGFVEATNVREVASGGVKNNHFDPKGEFRAKDYDKDVYGNVPYHRLEYCAETIRAYFNLDLALLRGYGLPAQAQELMIGLALLKVRRFLDAGLRLRTACDLTPSKPLQVTSQVPLVIPDEPALVASVQASIRACAQAGLFADPAVTVLTTDTVQKAAKGGA